jgi:endoglucanase
MLIKSVYTVSACLLVTLGLAAPASAATTGFYVDPGSAAAQWVAANPGDGRMPVIRDQIAKVPTARWYTTTNTDTIRDQVSSYVGAAAAAGKVPIVVVYDMPNRDCGGASAGGASSQTAYRAWIDQLAAGLAGRPAAIVLEPDVLAQMTACQTAAQQADTEASMAYAGKKLKAASASAKVYFDAGNSNWVGAADMAARMVKADVVHSANGISTNVSNFHWTADEVAYAKSVLGDIGSSSLHAVVDTSRNGNGPTADSQWCDPAGRKVGTPSTTSTGDAQIDAFLWVKHPGEADGCLASAGTFVPQRAYDLALGN